MIEIRSRRFLDLQRPRQRDVAVQMPLVKLVKYDRADTAQFLVGEHLPQQHAFGDVADACRARGDIVEANLIADLLAKLHAAIFRHPRRQHSGRQSPRLQNDDLLAIGAAPAEPAIEQHLRHLRGFARTRRRGQDQPPLLRQRRQQTAPVIPRLAGCARSLRKRV